MDNPQGWSKYTFFQAQYDKKAYTCHITPTGAQILHPNLNGTRVISEWEFHYSGWTPHNTMKATYSYQGAIAEDLKPASQKGSLDVGVHVSMD